MKIWHTILLAAIGVANVSCKYTGSVDSEARYQAWLLEAFKSEAASHNDALLVCIFDSHFQWSQRGYHHLECMGTVVRSYKGTWQVGEQITLHKEIEAAEKDWTPRVGYLEFYFVNKHTDDPIDIDVAEDWEYRPDFDRALASTYFREGRR